jgi:hypothetical protein
LKLRTTWKAPKKMHLNCLLLICIWLLAIYFSFPCLWRFYNFKNDYSNNLW